MTLGEKIKTERKKSCLSQEKIADIVGVSRQAVTKWEADQSAPSTENLIALAGLFHIPLDELVSNKAQNEAPQGKQPNLILRSNLTMLAIALQAGMLFSCTQVSYTVDEATGNQIIDRGFMLYKIVILLLCSVWMTSNLRFERDAKQRKKNSRIELLYCLVQLAAAFLTYRISMGLVGMLLMMGILLIYILVINPRYMNRKFTK